MTLALGVAMCAAAYAWQGAAHREHAFNTFCTAALTYLFAALVLYKFLQNPQMP